MAIPRMARTLAVYLVWVTAFACCIFVAEGKKKKRKPTQLTKQEATVAGFVRLVAMRLLFGLAQWAGLGEWASGLFGGALVPPGSDYDYGDYGGDYKDEYDGDGDDEYDY